MFTHTHTHTHIHTYISIIKKNTSIKNGQNIGIILKIHLQAKKHIKQYSIAFDSENANHNSIYIIIYIIYHIPIAQIKKINHTKFWIGWETIETHILLWEGKIIQPFAKKFQQFLKTLNIHLPYESAMPRETKACINIKLLKKCSKQLCYNSLNIYQQVNG